MYIAASMNTITVDYEGTTKSGLASSLNNVSWINPSTDVLLAYYRNMSGIYTPDFPEYPPVLFDFTGDEVPDYTTTTIQGTKIIQCTCMDTPSMWLAQVMGTLIM
ncbi:hypothetical protein ACB098_01G161100 [Castanea mollissima]